MLITISWFVCFYNSIRWFNVGDGDGDGSDSSSAYVWLQLLRTWTWKSTDSNDAKLHEFQRLKQEKDDKELNHWAGSNGRNLKTNQSRCTLYKFTRSNTVFSHSHALKSVSPYSKRVTHTQHIKRYKVQSVLNNVDDHICLLSLNETSLFISSLAFFLFVFTFGKHCKRNRKKKQQREIK